jgi:hypothetical protein
MENVLNRLGKDRENYGVHETFYVARRLHIVAGAREISISNVKRGKRVGRPTS